MMNDTAYQPVHSYEIALHKKHGNLSSWNRTGCWSFSWSTNTHRTELDANGSNESYSWIETTTSIFVIDGMVIESQRISSRARHSGRPRGDNWQRR